LCTLSQIITQTSAIVIRISSYDLPVT